MTKLEFIGALSQRLQSLPRQELDKITSFYSEIVCDRMEDGMSEEAAVAALGSVEDAARQAMRRPPDTARAAIRAYSCRFSAAGDRPYGENWGLPGLCPCFWPQRRCGRLPPGCIGPCIR